MSTPPSDAPLLDLARLRRDYSLAPGERGLDEADLAADWPTQFGRWLADSVAAGIAEPNAMVLATADAAGRPSARTVLLKGYDHRGFALFTNYRSRKGVEVTENPHASLVFPWHAMRRQVVVCGLVERIDRAESAAYFALRPRDAQLGAWASEQSSVIGARDVLDERWRELRASYPEGVELPMPEHWGGLRVVPETVEFWQGQASRLHDRLRYRRVGPASTDGWVVERLAP